jgi:cardiolipin synthase
LISALHAVQYGRTSQGSIAWAVSLVTLPFVALPFYWVFGRRRFDGYVERLRARFAGREEEVRAFRALLRSLAAEVPAAAAGPIAAIERLARMPLTRGNHVELLVDGAAKFEALFAAIDAAQEYVLVQYYIVQDDAVARELKQRLLARLAVGVRVAFLYDAVGSFRLPRAWVTELVSAGALVRAFRTSRGLAQMQINFRNHRKIVVVDGRVAFAGGINVGDEYLGRGAIGPWRDTHVRAEGPLVQELQVSFAADWIWTDGPRLDLEWTPQASSRGNQSALALATGPADEEESCALFFLQAISSATQRLWIATPYFVPDAPIFEALKLAAMRGVDVRVLLPEKSDSSVLQLASFTFLTAAERAGIRMFRYTAGFLHQKVLLVDRVMATVGSANLDNRSMRLNFEVTAVVIDAGFASQVEAMLERDFERSRQIGAGDFENRLWVFRVAARTVRLLEPIL